MPNATVDTSFGAARTIAALRARVDQWKRQGLTVGFVPTMGALHDGHLALVKLSNKLADRTVASVFVNPKQFAAHEDLGSYPRREAQDLELLKGAGCHLAYCPGADEMYPPGFQTAVTVSAVSQGLCGASRPHFFGGVATVVTKLLNQVRPNVAVFGEKDYQQLLVIRRLVRDLDMGVDIVGAPIVREKDGLAMSSRNAYLTEDERKRAGGLNRVIAAAAARLEAGAAVDAAMAEAAAALAEAGFPPADYLEVRDAADLAPLGPGPIERPARVFVAVMLGKTRLIDNWPANPPAQG